MVAAALRADYARRATCAAPRAYSSAHVQRYHGDAAAEAADTQLLSSRGGVADLVSPHGAGRRSDRAPDAQESGARGALSALSDRLPLRSVYAARHLAGRALPAHEHRWLVGIRDQQSRL